VRISVHAKYKIGLRAAWSSGRNWSPHQNPLASPYFGDATGQQYGHHSMGSRMMKPSIPLPGLILGVANYVILASSTAFEC
jgi:hypothetical protein